MTAYRGKGRAAQLEGLGAAAVLVTSYDVVLRDQAALAGQRFATLVLDEAQAIKNAAAKRAGAVHALSAEFRVALTGTPIENHLSELWSILHAVQPGLLGPARHFRWAYAKPIEQHGDPVALERLKQRVRPFLLRRKKSEVEAELPPRTDSVRRVRARSGRTSDLRHRQEGRAREARTRARRRSRSAHRRLGRALAPPAARVPSAAGRPSSPVPSSKLAAFEALAEELRDAGHRALVFSQFTRHLALVRERLDALRIPYVYLDGATPAPSRRARIEAFSSGDVPFFLISLKAGGTGLNLTAADTVVHLDPWWNPATEDQASDRAHRIGQDKPVTVVRLVASGTIEESVYALHEKKRALAEELLAGTSGAGTLSTRELVGLIRGGAAAGAD